MESAYEKALGSGGFSALLFSCGGSGGGSNPSTSSIPVYFTDDMSVYSSILVKVYEVNLCSDNSSQQKVNLFTSQQGLQTDLAKLNGVLRFNGVVQPFSMGKLVIDFVLKEFEVNTSTNPWQVYEVKMKPLTPQETAGKTNEIHLIVQNTSTQNNNFTGTRTGKTYTVNLIQTTAYEINHVYYPASQCLTQIQQGRCAEVKVQEDPATSTSLTAVKIETEDANKCIK